MTKPIYIILLIIFCGCSAENRNNRLHENKKSINYCKIIKTYDTSAIDKSKYPTKDITFTRKFKKDTIRLFDSNGVFFEEIISTDLSCDVAKRIYLDSIGVKSKNGFFLQINSLCKISLNEIENYKHAYIYWSSKDSNIVIDHSNLFKTFE